MKRSLIALSAMLVLLATLSLYAPAAGKHLRKPKSTPTATATATPTPTPMDTLSPRATETIPAQKPDQYTIDDATHTITVNPVGDYTTNLQTLTAQLANRPDKTQAWTLQLTPGTYNLTDSIETAQLENVHITSADKTQPATLTKGPDWSDEYIFICKYCANIRISHLQFAGLMTVYNPADSDHWTDQGVWLSSSHDIRVDHSAFRNIGNAAIRVNTTASDPVPGVNSWNSWIEDNTFENVWQLTTTSDNTVTRGGTRNFWAQRNRFTDLRGSLKFCSRTPGARDAHILNNTWLNSTHHAIELCSVNNIEIQGNTFNDIEGFIVNAYTNDQTEDGQSVQDFQWGDNITIADNTSTQTEQALRFSFSPCPGGLQPVGHNLKISNNTITQVTNTDPGAAAIRVVNGPVIGATLIDNTLTDIANQNYWSFADGSSDILLQGNTATP